jgi:hypothetical protein
VGLGTCGLDVYAIGDGIAPARQSSDATNVAWCLANRSALVTVDRGRKNPEIKELLARYSNLSLVLVDRRFTPIELLYAFVKKHEAMEREVERCFSQGGRYRVRLKRGGGIERL